MGTPLGPKYIPYAYMDPLGCSASGRIRGMCSPGTWLPDRNPEGPSLLTEFFDLLNPSQPVI